MAICDFCSKSGDEGVDIVVYFEFSICSQCCESFLAYLEDGDHKFGEIDVVKTNGKWSVVDSGKEHGKYESLVQAFANAQDIQQNKPKITIRILGDRDELICYLKTQMLRWMLYTFDFKSMSVISEEEDRVDILKRPVMDAIVKRFKSVYEMTEAEVQRLHESIMKDLLGN